MPWLRLWLLLVSGILAPSAASSAPATVVTPSLHVYVFRVGQGDATLLVSSSGKTALIDAGPQSAEACAGPAGLVTALTQLGLTRLDLFVASHYDADHIGCADEVLSRWPAASVWDRGISSPPSSQTYSAYVAAAGTRRRTVIVGDSMTLDGTIVTVVAVNGNGRSLASSNQNDRGVVLRLRHGAFDGLLGGDISSILETDLAPSLGPVEWYKVHHHGSATSSSEGFVATITPKVATLSVGAPNAYDHPRSAALDVLRRTGAITYWTTVGDGTPPQSPGDVVADGTIELRVNDTGTAFDVRTPTRADGYAAWGAAMPCVATTVSPATLTTDASGGSATLTLTAGADCAWTASTSASWLTISATSGTGPGTLTLSAAANPTSASRSATVSYAGQTITVTQGVATGTRPIALTVAAITGHTVTLRWQWPGPAPDRYVLKGGLAQGHTLASLPISSQAPEFTFDAPTGTFFVRIAGVRDGTELPASDDVRIVVEVPEAPSAPAMLLGLANGSGLSLSWSNTADGGAATGLMLDVSGAIETSLSLAVSDQFSFSGVPPGTYTFRLRATNGAGSSAASNAVTLSFPGGCQAPAAPRNLEAYVVGQMVTIRWETPAAGAAATDYVLSVEGAASLRLPVSGRTLSSPAPPGRYVFTVAARNACGTSQSTAAVSVTVP